MCLLPPGGVAVPGMGLPGVGLGAALSFYAPLAIYWQKQLCKRCVNWTKVPSVVIGLKQASYSQKLVLACPLVMKTNPKVMSLFEMQASQVWRSFCTWN